MLQVFYPADTFLSGVKVFYPADKLFVRRINAQGYSYTAVCWQFAGLLSPDQRLCRDKEYIMEAL